MLQGFRILKTALDRLAMEKGMIYTIGGNEKALSLIAWAEAALRAFGFNFNQVMVRKEYCTIHKSSFHNILPDTTAIIFDSFQ